MRDAWRAAVILAVVTFGGCTPRPLLERAIRARGGSLQTLVRQGETRVHQGIPGTWQWRTAFLGPDRFAVTIVTADEPYHYLFDGRVVRAFIGDRAVSADPDRAAPLRTEVRFTAVVNLDVLRLPGYRVVPLAAAELLPGATEGLAAVSLEDGARYRLGFDDRGLLAWATGTLDLRPVGRGEVIARFGDFRRVKGLVLPFRTTYAFGDTALAEEEALAVCPNLPGDAEAWFQAPRAVPECPG